MTDLVPNISGPKLSRFSKDMRNAIFERLLSSEDDHNVNSDPHSRVFRILLEEKGYALKIFNFINLEKIRPFVPGREHLVDDYDVSHHKDPFFAECRAFGKLRQAGKDNLLAVRCHGYTYLSKDIELRIQQQFDVSDWNREAEDEDHPLRAIVKDYIRFKSPFTRKQLPKMREKLEQLHKLGIYNMDIRKENYLGGRLFDFSSAITSPHIDLWNELRSEEKIVETMNDDLECFDSMEAEFMDSEAMLAVNIKQAAWAKRLRKRT